MDDPGKPSVIIRVLTSERGRQKSQHQTLRKLDQPLRAQKTEAAHKKTAFTSRKRNTRNK